MASSIPSITLRGTGDKLPLVGLGTWKAEAGVVGASVEAAIKAGYRHFDCACDYGNEAEVGQLLYLTNLFRFPMTWHPCKICIMLTGSFPRHTGR